MATPFEMYGNDPHVWKETAEALVYNAGVLKAHRAETKAPNASAEVNRTFAELLLWGYALEVFFKCLFLKNGGKLVKGETLDSSVGMWSHNLVPMANKAGYPLDDPRQDMLVRLSSILTWGGRYPIATRSQKTLQPCPWSDVDDDPLLEGLIASLRQAVL